MAMTYLDVIASLYPGKPVSANGDASVYANLSWIDGTPIAQATLDSQRLAASKALQTTAISNQLVTALSTPFLYNGFTWDTDVRATAFIISQAFVLNNLLATLLVNTVWHDSAGVTHTLSKSDFIALHNALTVWRNACYAVSWQLKAQVAAMTTETAIWALDIVAPFPTSYTAAQTVMASSIP